MGLTLWGEGLTTTDVVQGTETVPRKGSLSFYGQFSVLGRDLEDTRRPVVGGPRGPALQRKDMASSKTVWRP